jgi:hypothetical protein
MCNSHLTGIRYSILGNAIAFPQMFRARDSHIGKPTATKKRYVAIKVRKVVSSGVIAMRAVPSELRGSGTKLSKLPLAMINTCIYGTLVSSYRLMYQSSTYDGSLKFKEPWQIPG